MLTIELNKVKNYQATGTISPYQLSAKQLEALNITLTDDTPDLVVEIEFFVEFDDDIPMPQIESCYIVGAKNGKFYKAPIGQYTEIVPKGQGCNCIHTIYGLVEATSDLVLEYDEYNAEQIEELLANSGNDSDWASDRMASMADYYYDRDR